MSILESYMRNWYYVGGISFCDVPVIAIFVAYFTMAQIFMHGLMVNKKMGTLYNPGVATALLVNIPMGIYALWFIATNLDVASWCWLAPILAFPFVAFLTILLPIKLCEDKETRYVFPKRDMIQGRRSSNSSYSCWNLFISRCEGGTYQVPPFVLGPNLH